MLGRPSKKKKPKAAKVKKAYSAKEIAKRVEAIGEKIRQNAGDDDVFLLGILKGSSFFTADLMRAIKGKVGYGFIDVVRDSADQLTTDAIEIDFLSYTSISGRNVYVLKDVVQTGVIETYLLNQLRSHNPASLQLVALLDRPSARTAELKTDYSAFTIKDGSFVGYGLELEGQYANLPYIGRLT